MESDDDADGGFPPRHIHTNFQGRRKVQKWGGDSKKCVMGIVCAPPPLFWVGLTDLPKTERKMPPDPLFFTALAA